MKPVKTKTTRGSTDLDTETPQLLEPRVKSKVTTAHSYDAPPKQEVKVKLSQNQESVCDRFLKCKEQIQD